MQFNKLYLFLTNLFLIVLYQGCESNLLEPDPDRMGYEFYPLAKGIIREYRVNEIRYTFNKPDSLLYYLREEVVDSTLNLENNYSYVLARYTRNSSYDDWEQDSLRRLEEKNNKFVRVTENNESFIKLVFPVKNGIQWDGNAYNSRDAIYYSIENAYGPYQLGDSAYSSTVTVINQYEPDKIVNYIEKLEVYALDIGLIYKQIVDLKYSTEESKLGQEWINEGIIFKQVLMR